MVADWFCDLFSGQYDEAYAKKRIAIGEIHVKVGLPVRYLPDVGNRSKPGGCCGAHYGANEAAWKAFVADVKAFLAKNLQ